MANIKNSETTTKNYTKEELQNKKLAEESVWVGNEQLKSPPGWLRDKRALEEWNRLIIEFMKTDIISNLDYNNLGNYCNVFSKSVELENLISKTGLFAGRNQSPYVALHMKISEELRKWAVTLGLTVQSRLQGSKGALEGKKKELGDDFGDI